jgi:hypothetical protein
MQSHVELVQPPTWQSWPHEPQFLGSEVVSTHVPLQLVCPVGQEHAPLMQLAPTPQTLPHTPQL